MCIPIIWDLEFLPSEFFLRIPEFIYVTKEIMTLRLLSFAAKEVNTLSGRYQYWLPEKTVSHTTFLGIPIKWGRLPEKTVSHIKIPRHFIVSAQ